MTEVYADLQVKMKESGNKVIQPYLETSQVQAISQYQIAESLIEINKTLKRIEEQMKKRKV